MNTKLILSSSAWDALRPLMVDRGRVAVGGLRWRSGADWNEALADAVSLAERLPHGVERPPLDDFLVVASMADGGAANDLLAEIQPRPSQIAVVLLLDAARPGRWDGAIFRDETIAPLSGFQVAGAGMLAVERDTAAADRERDVRAAALGENDDDDATELDFSLHEVPFSRMRGAVGEAVYQKLRRAVVTLVGVSRNGTLAAQQLAALGVSLLRLADPQRVGEENLDGMPGVPRESLGQYKTHAVAEQILAQRPDMGVTCCEFSLLAPESACLFSTRSDLIVTCVDDDAARVAATIHARRLLAPHLDIATSVQRNEDGTRRIFGDARLFLSGQGCAACVPRLTAEEREEVLYEINSPPGALHRGEEQSWHAQRAGSLITINAVTVAAGVQAWLDLLSGQLRTSFWQRLDWRPGAGLQVRSSAVDAAEDCRFCRL